VVPDGAFTHPAPPTEAPPALAGRGDDMLLGDQPAPGGPPEASSFDICNGQQGTDLAVPDTCELEIQIEGAASLEEG
jgi:hypothetical protein